MTGDRVWDKFTEDTGFELWTLYAEIQLIGQREVVVAARKLLTLIDTIWFVDSIDAEHDESISPSAFDASAREFLQVARTALGQEPLR